MKNCSLTLAAGKYSGSRFGSVVLNVQGSATAADSKLLARAIQSSALPGATSPDGQLAFDLQAGPDTMKPACQTVTMPQTIVTLQR